MLQNAEQESRVRKRELLKNKTELEVYDTENSVGVRSLTVTHIQGPVLILVSGICCASLCFLVEYFIC